MLKMRKAEVRKRESMNASLSPHPVLLQGLNAGGIQEAAAVLS